MVCETEKKPDKAMVTSNSIPGDLCVLIRLYILREGNERQHANIMNHRHSKNRYYLCISNVFVFINL